ncbi:MAG TPA: phosphoglycerate mutase family protein [Acidimicrobiia bacterium]|nr:phosphoglycerate mutase family protein [Acidimicrobiia bacterium]
MTVYVVRHAKAGSRSAWDGPDDLRPLTKVGRRQAEALVDLLGDCGITRIVSSPSVRCRQTVEPLAQRLRLPVDLSDALVEGATTTEVLRLIDKVGDEQAVLCTHGDVVGALLEELRNRPGVDVAGDAFEKGSTWALDVESGSVTAARYLEPPA